MRFFNLFSLLPTELMFTPRKTPKGQAKNASAVLETEAAWEEEL